MIIPHNITEDELNEWWEDASEDARSGYKAEIADELYEYQLYCADQIIGNEE